MASKTNLILLLSLLLISSGHAEIRDPTKPPQLTANNTTLNSSDKEMTLSAIWISAISRRVTINGVTAKQGDTILNGVKVIQIWHNSVTIKQNGVSKTLRLIKKPYKKQLSSKR